MKSENIVEAIEEAERFITRAKKLLAKRAGKSYVWSNPKESGAVRRSSMDLTRSLANMRGRN